MNNDEIPEQEVNFAEESEPINFLRKDYVNGLGGLDLNLTHVTKKQMKAKSGSEYTAYTCHANNGYDEYQIGPLMRSDMKWKKRPTNPKRIKVTVEKVGDYNNWVIKALD